MRKAKVYTEELRGDRQLFCAIGACSTIPLLPLSYISSLYPSPEAVQPGLCQPSSESPKTGFDEAHKQ